MNKRAVITYYMTFVVVTFLLIFLTAIFFPIASMMATSNYAMGDELLADANATINSINDATVKAQIQDSLAEARGAQQENITIFTAMYQYSWVIIAGMVMLILFLIIRRNVDYGQGGIQ